jgi:hypothetical protein
MKALRRFHQAVLAFVLIFSFVPLQPAQADSPVEIATVQQLIDVHTNLTADYVLTADIDMSSVANWTPLGDATTPFSGSFDGGGHTIYNLIAADTQTNDQGLFGVIDTFGIVIDLRLEGARVTGANRTGILAGTNLGTINRVGVEGIVSGATTVGGLVGVNSGDISDAYAHASVSGKDLNGGLVGSNSGNLTNVYAVSTVSGAVTNTNLLFDGVNDYVVIPHNSAYVTSNFTLEAWFNWKATDRTDVNFIIGKGLENFEIHTGGGAGANGIRFIPVLRTDTLNKDQTAYQDIHNVLAPGWNHVAASWDFDHQQVRVFLNGVPQHIYQNGVDVGTIANLPLENPEVNPLADNTNDFFIGARNDNGSWFYFNGSIADVRFWNIVRTPAEIAADKDKQLTGSETGLVGYWKLDETNGTAVYDSSSYHNDGTILGATRQTNVSINGGLVGENTGTISSAYYDSTVSALSDTGKGTGLSTTAMQTQSTYAGWDFVSDWKIIDGHTYPALFTHKPGLTITSVSPALVAGGTPYTVSVAVDGGYIGQATGSVTISDGDGHQCTASLSAGAPSTGSCALTSLTNGVKTIQATFPGNAVFSAANDTAAQTVDAVAPTVQIEQAAGQADPTNAAEIHFTATFSEPVLNFTAADITLSGSANPANAVLTEIAPQDGTTYDIAVSGMSGDGTVTAAIDAGKVQDAAGNSNSASDSNDNQVTNDTHGPGVSFGSSAADPTASSPVNVTVTFTESVSDFSSADVTLSNAALSNFSGSGASYSFDLTPSGQGAFSADIAAGSAHDAAGNPNDAAAQFSRTYDSVNPTVTLASTSSDPTNSTPISVSVTFSESVNGFTASDITLTNATLSNFSGSADSYQFDLTPAGQGTFTADVAAGTAADAAGNPNSAAAQFSRTYDSLNPSVLISSAASSPTNSSPIAVEVTFSENVADFTSADVTLSNAALSNFSGSGASYSFDLTPSGQGAFSADIAAGTAHDAAGNPNDAAAQFSRTFDSVNPTVTLASTSSDPTNSTPISVSVTFSESVNGFTASDITLTNATLSNFSGSADSYQFDLTPAGQGTFTADVAAGTAADATGNPNSAAAQFSRTYDSLNPSVLINSAASSPTNSSPIAVEVTFNENVADFTSADVTLSNAVLTDFSGSGAAYSFNITPAAEGIVAIDIAAGTAHDAAGNPNDAAAQFSRTYDSIGPVITFSSASPASTNSAPIAVNVSISESVSDFTSADITLSNATLSDFSGSGDQYSFNLTPAGEGAVTADVTANAIHDAAGNGNLAADQFTRTYDTTGPTIVMSSASTDPTNTAPIPVSVDFSETVTGFTADDIAVTNGSAGNLQGSGTAYTFDLTPASQGLVSVEIASGSVTDAAGNSNPDSTSFTRTYDSDRPTVVLSTTASSTTNLAVIPLTITFSEPVSGLEIDDVLVSNGSAGSLAGSGAVYTAEITPSADGEVTINLAAGAAEDVTGNLSQAASPLTIRSDRTAPDAVLNQADGQDDPTLNTPILFTLVFDEPINPDTLEAADLTLSGTAAGPLSAEITQISPMDGTTFAVSVSGMSTDGTVILQLGADQVEDLAGNTNLAASFSDNSVLFQTVKTTTVELNAVPRQLGISQVWELTATVTSSAETPVGEVTFLDNGTPLGVRPLVNGSATFVLENPAGGLHQFSVTYAGEGLYQASASAEVPVQARYWLVLSFITR